MVKQIIKEAMAQNPLGLKEAVAEELRARVALALESKMDDLVEGYNEKDVVFKAGEFVVTNRNVAGPKQDKYQMYRMENGKVVDYGSHSSVEGAKKFAKSRGWLKESNELEEAAKWELNPAVYMVGGDLRYDDKLEYTLKKADSDVLNRFLSKASDDEKSKVWKMFWDSKERGNNTAQGPANAIKYAKKALKESVELEEAKMTDAEVLSAAKSLAANGKDPKTKAFGKGLVDFYKKEGSFTPAQVGGLQNIMKNASFQMAKDK
jgi:hypothetical protein